MRCTVAGARDTASKSLVQLLIDSTTIEVEVEGEWHARKHGGFKIRQCTISTKLRKMVDMASAHLERILGFGRLRPRGPCGAKDELLLAATALNLRKPAKIFPAP